MDGRSRSENRKAARLLTLTDNIDRDRLTRVRVVIRKINLEKLGPGGTLKLSKKPFVRLKKVEVPSRLLTELRKEYSIGARYWNKLKVKVVDDDEIDLIKEAQAEHGKKKEKLKVRVIQDSQTVVIAEISKYDCVFQRKTEDVKQIICIDLEPVRRSEKISVTIVSDADSKSIRDVGEQRSVRKPIRLQDSALRYLKPSKTDDDYGLGGRAEIDRDDVDQPIKQIPVWAESRNYLEQMSSQADVDTDMIFAVCDPPNMREMFPNSSNTGSSWETPPQKIKSKKISKEKNGNSLEYFSRNLLTSFYSA